MATSDYNGYLQNMKKTVKGVKLKSESFFSISYGVLELWRKNAKGGGFRPPSPLPKVKLVDLSTQTKKIAETLPMNVSEGC